MTVQIMADSTCDLSPALCAAYAIPIIPLYVTMGDESYLDGVSLTPSKILDYVATTKQTPKTSAPSVHDFCAFFRPVAQRGQDIVFIGISSEMSVTVDNARAAAQSFPDVTIACVDSRNLSTGIGLLVLEAVEMARAGHGAQAIADAIRALTSRVCASFVVDTMEYLYRGGRCSAVQAYAATWLSIKPQINVTQGTMHPTEKYRGSMLRVTKAYAKRALSALERIDPRRVFITYSPCDAGQAAVARAVVEETGYFKEILETQAGCVITSHCGPGTLGVLYMLKDTAGAAEDAALHENAADQPFR